MAATDMTPAPVRESERIEGLDVLRGVAVLGILMVNVQVFAMVYQAYQYPPAHMDLTGANLTAWIVTHVFFELKFITIFSALFGAGIVLMVGDGPDSTTRLHYRRMAWLLGIGLVHAYVFWYGDILVSYAVAGMVVVLFRRMTPVKLIGWGLFWIVLSGLLLVGAMASFQFLPEEMGPEAVGMAPTDEALRDAVAAYQAGFVDRLPNNALMALFGQLSSLSLFAGRLVGVMFIGMALFKIGFLTGRWSAGAYLAALVAGLAIGLPLAGFGARSAVMSGFALDHLWVHTLTNYVGSLFVSLGYAALVMLIVKAPWLRLVRAPLRAAGRMAFTNYLTQTLVMTFIFVGPPGLGLFGEVERATQVLIVLGVWAAQLVISPLWLAAFRYGPFEWLWRSLTYGRAQPIRRRAEDAPA